MTRLSLAFSVWMAMAAGLLALAGAARAQPAQNEPATTEPAKTPEGSEGTEELVYVKMATSMGDIIIELNKAKAPLSVENFLKYTDAKHYDGTIFHRVIADFMIQGGGFTSDMKQKKTEAPIKNEWQNGLKNTRGTLAMARLGDRKPNPATVDSATSQFFINVKDNPFLDQKQADGGAYAVFGRVVEGMDVVDKIKVVPTKSVGPMDDVPGTAVMIQTVARLSEDELKDLKSRLSDATAPASSGQDPKTDPATNPKR